MLERIIFLVGAFFALVVSAMVISATLLPDGVAQDNAEATAPSSDETPFALPHLSVGIGGLEAEVQRATAELEAEMAAAAARPDPYDQVRARIESAQLEALRGPATEAPEGYYTTWSDMIARCWTTVSQGAPMDETGLVPLDEQRIDYSQSSRQEWVTENRQFIVTLWIGYGNSEVELARQCWVKTTGLRLAPEPVLALKTHYDAWFAAENLAPVTVFQPPPWEPSRGQRYHIAHTTFGSAQRCPMRIEYSDIGLSALTKATFYVGELTDDACTLAVGSSAGGIRVNRLPQVTD